MIGELIVSLVERLPLLAVGAGGTAAILGGALALGLRHGIDWDHIAAITDITSASASSPSAGEALLSREPGVQLTDEHHHALLARPEPKDHPAPTPGGL